MPHFVKRAWAEIDLDAAAHNFEIIKQTAAGKTVVAVIKADAYGHGAVRLAQLYESLGAGRFAVSNIDEASELRNNGIGLPIIILGYTPVSEVAELAKLDIIQAVFSKEYAEKLSGECRRLGISIKVDIKLDTGMGRIGFNCRSMDAVKISAVEAAACAKLPGFIVDGAFIHFAAADRDSDPDASFTRAQYKRFITATELIKSHGVELPFCHCCNSAGTMLHEQMHLDGMRVGIILYGLTPNPGLEFIDKFRPVMSFRSSVSMIKKIFPGETISYGRTFTAEREMTVATVSVGYADGYPRSASNKGRVIVRGGFAPIVGRVCMDQLIVDVTDIAGVCEGDTVTLFGTDGAISIPTEEVAAYSGTINYETVCGVGSRVPRVYIKDGKIESVLNRLV